MNLRFDRVDIENFRSIQHADVKLSNQGTVIVKGINEYEDKATSNGSGKSSVFEAIIFALFDETSSGEKDVANRIINNGYAVTLYFNVDGDDYVVHRYSTGNKSSVTLHKNDIDISARNKTDTNKLILQLIGINKNIFLDSIVLSQGASTNLATLSPTARKERLEILTNTDYTINKFKDELKQIQIEYEARCTKAQLELTKLSGTVESLNKQRDGIQSSIDNIDKQIARRNALGNLDEIENFIKEAQNKISEMQTNLDNKEAEIINQETKIEEFRKLGEDDLNAKTELNNKINSKLNECNDVQNDMDNLNFKSRQCDKEIKRLNIEISEIKNSDTCPTCGRKYENINEEHIQNKIAELENNIKQEQEKIDENNKQSEELNSLLEVKISEGKSLRAEMEELDGRIDKFKQNLEDLISVKQQLNTEKSQISSSIKALQHQINDNIAKKDQILKFEVGNKDEYLAMLQGIDAQLIDIAKSQETYREEYNMNDEYINVIKHSIQLVTKEFRTYLLQNSIDYLNKLLLEYSRELFSNDKDIIVISSDDAKLDIKLGDATYESLSGGEKTRVNIALLLAQKSLASVIGNISCNMIILDEILGYCDSQAESNVIDLISRELESLESIYMVSHKEIPIGYDTQLIIVKDKSGLSRVRDY